ncbi:MAG: hypothetical protein KAT05_06330 [Spirochaetes bacterium]|nr:hypothetical protein [Spirochaetota bacterium]
MPISLMDAYDKIDKAIIYISQDKPADKWKIQKGVFYFLWLETRNNDDFINFANKIQIHPNKQGPYSETIDGEVEMLIRDGFLQVIDPTSKSLPIKASEKGISEYLSDISPEEKFCLQQIKDIVEKLTSYEVVFFIYFNPYIPDEIKSYFISKSEMKDGLMGKKNRYIKKFLDLGIIDDSTATKMLNEIKKIES